MSHYFLDIQYKSKWLIVYHSLVMKAFPLYKKIVKFYPRGAANERNEFDLRRVDRNSFVESLHEVGCCVDTAWVGPRSGRLLRRDSMSRSPLFFFLSFLFHILSFAIFFIIIYDKRYLYSYSSFIFIL